MTFQKSNFGVNRTLLLITFYIILTMATITQYLIVPNYETIREEFNINPILVGLISTSFLLALTFSILFWGYYTDKFERIKLLIIGMVISTTFSILTFFSKEYWQLIIMQIGTAIGIGACYPIGFSMINDVTKPEKRASTFAWWSIAIGIGSGLGIIIGGIIVDWRAPFLYIALPNIAIILLLFCIKEPRRGASEFAVEQSTNSSYFSYNYRIERSDVRKLLRKKSMLYINLQGFLSAIPIGIVSYWVITLYILEYNMSKSTASFASIIVFLGMLLESYIFGILGDKKFLNDRQAHVKICIWTTVSCIPLWILVFLFPFKVSPDNTIFDVILIPLAVFMFFMGLLASTVNEGSVPNKFSILSNITLPEHKGTAMAMYNFSIYLGIGISPLIGGILSTLLGGNLRLAIILGFFFWIPSIIFLILIKKKVEGDLEEISETLRTRAKKLKT